MKATISKARRHAAAIDLLTAAERLGNVSKACEQFGVSRDTFYRYKALQQEGRLAIAEGAAARVSKAGKKAAARKSNKNNILVIPARSARENPTNRLVAAADTADIIRRAALELFSSQNFSTVTMKDIAAATGLNAALVYYYFGSKEGLFLSVVDSTTEVAIGAFESIRDPHASPRDIVSLWIENHILQFDLMRKLIKISIDFAATHRNSPKIERAIRRFYQTEAKILGAALTEGVKRGLFRKCDVTSTVNFISIFLDGVLVRSVMMPEFNTADAIRDLRNRILADLSAK
jgi:AcrR family transcriptional regulator